MTSLDELRRTLDQQADRAPGGLKVFEAIERRAGRLRRRRAVGRGMVAVFAVAALVVTGPIVIRVGADSITQDPAEVAALSARKTSQLTLELASDKDWKTLYHSASSTTQYAIARISNPNLEGDGLEITEPKQLPPGWSEEKSPVRIGSVAVHDPGTYDPSNLLKGKHTTIQGRDAYYVTDFIIGYDYPAPRFSAIDGRFSAAVGWQDSAGRWFVVTVHKGIGPEYLANVAEVTRLANLVRITPPRDLMAAFSLRRLPAGASLQHASIAEVGSENRVFLGPTAAATPDAHHTSRDFPLSVTAYARSTYLDGMIKSRGAPTKVAGLDTWEITGNLTEYDAMNWDWKAGERILAIQTPTCHIRITAIDATTYSSEDLKQIAEGATFNSCTDKSTWAPLIP